MRAVLFLIRSTTLFAPFFARIKKGGGIFLRPALDLMREREREGERGREGEREGERGGEERERGSKVLTKKKQNTIFRFSLEHRRWRRRRHCLSRAEDGDTVASLSTGL